MSRKPDSNTVVIFSRIPPDVAAQLDAYVVARSKKEPMLPVNRSDAIRILLAKALATEVEAGVLAEPRGRRT